MPSSTLRGPLDALIKLYFACGSDTRAEFDLLLELICSSQTFQSETAKRLPNPGQLIDQFPPSTQDLTMAKPTYPAT